MQIIVLGPHRSGTSLVTRLINMMGAYFDSGQHSIGFNDENPKGFWERNDVLRCDDALLELNGCRWDRLAAWKPLTTGELPADAPMEIEKRMKNIVLELDANRPWVVKDPRMCLTFPYWRPHLEVPVAVSVHRDPMEVAQSLQKRNGFSYAHGLAIWEYSAVGTLNAIRELPVVFIEHKEIITQPVEVVARLHQTLTGFGVQNLRLPGEKEITSFIEPSLYRSKLDDTPDKMLTPYQTQLAEMASGRAPLPKEPLRVSLAALDAMKAVEKTAALETQLAEARQMAEAERQHLDEARQQHEILEQEKTQLHEEAQALRDTIAQRDADLHFLRTSRSWKLGNGLVRLMRLK